MGGELYTQKSPGRAGWAGNVQQRAARAEALIAPNPSAQGGSGRGDGGFSARRGRRKSPLSPHQISFRSGPEGARGKGGPGGKGGERAVMIVRWERGPQTNRHPSVVRGICRVMEHYGITQRGE